MSAAKHYNARPSLVPNLGEDVPRAARHRNDTFETPEELRAKALKKKSNDGTKLAKELFKKEIKATNDFHSVIGKYETRVFLAKFGETIAPFSPKPLESLSEIKFSILGHSELRRNSELVRAFNRAINRVHRAKYRVRSLEDAENYLTPKKKDSFQEKIGHVSPWKSSEKVLCPTFAVAMTEKVKAVQFGNSVPENERVYVLKNLYVSLCAVNLILDYDFKSLSFSYGARGNGKSVAFYQDSLKVLSFNRHVDGALLHELGHAVDYSMGLVSWKLPSELIDVYRMKLRSKNIKGRAFTYYANRKEIFARLFEQFIALKLGMKLDDKNFMFSNEAPEIMPDLNEDAIAWLEENLSTLLVKVSK